MAIAPPSDLMLDVARAAEPAKVREATARLARLAADPSAGNEAFDKALSAARIAGRPATPPPAAATSPAASPAGPEMAPMRSATKSESEVYRKFEAVLLQNFVESILPKDAETFGDANSAGIYRSMMAEQLADQISKAGGIGVAKAIEKAHPAAHKTAAADDAAAPLTPSASS